MERIVDLHVSLPGLRASRKSTALLHAGMKDHYGVGRIDAGESEWWGSGAKWRSSPGCILLKQPGDVHRDLARYGTTVFTVVTLPADEVEHVRRDAGALAMPQLQPEDARASPFHRLLDAVVAGADRLTLEVAVTEAVSALVAISNVHPDYSRPVRRAREYVRELLDEPITLDDLADYAGLDKFHLCRAFRAQIGMAPHAYLTHLRIARAKRLLLGGVRASDVAPMVGLYDQAQLTRHFRRLVGTTPARFSKWPDDPTVRSYAGVQSIKPAKSAS